MAEQVSDELLPAAIVVDDELGAHVVPVDELDGAIVDRDTGAPLDLDATVIVVGLPDPPVRAA